MIQQNRLIEQFISLIQVDSESRFEQAISKVLKERFSELGLQVVEDDSAVLHSLDNSTEGLQENHICSFDSNV